MALADVAVDLQEPFYQDLRSVKPSELSQRFEKIEADASQKLVSQGQHEESIVYERYLSLQYQGSDTTLMIREPENGDFAESFKAEHKREFAFVLDSPIMIAGVRIRAAARATQESSASPYMEELRQIESALNPAPAPTPFARNRVYYEEVKDFLEVPLFRLEDLAWGSIVSGPAIILDNTQTIVLHPQNTASILRSHVL